MTEHIKDIKGAFHHWTDESADWYQRASDYTGYHEALTRRILPYLRPDDTCCELACGTGTLARNLAPHVAHYTANDIDPIAIAFNEKQLSAAGRAAATETASIPAAAASESAASGRAGRPTKPRSGIESIELVKGDWRTALAGRTFDTVLFSFFSAILHHWEALQSLATRQVIAITYGQRAGKPRKGKHSKQEWASDIAEFLTARNIDCHFEEFTLEFGQPLRDRQEARRYVEYYYHLEEKQIEEFLDSKLTTRPDGTLYFPKEKHLGLVVIPLQPTDAK